MHPAASIVLVAIGIVLILALVSSCFCFRTRSDCLSNDGMGKIKIACCAPIAACAAVPFVITEDCVLTAPPSTSNLTVELWGAGGGGTGFTQNQIVLSGGGSGAYATASFPVKSGDKFTIEIGKGGRGGPDMTRGRSGGTTRITANDFIIEAMGGSGGDIPPVATNYGKGGKAQVIGKLPRGSYFFSIRGGDSLIGEFSNVDAGGSAPRGGSGGNNAFLISGVTNFSPGANGVFPGGGGGGASVNGQIPGILTNVSGDGADGVLIATWQ